MVVRRSADAPPVADCDWRFLSSTTTSTPVEEVNALIGGRKGTRADARGIPTSSGLISRTRAYGEFAYWCCQRSRRNCVPPHRWWYTAPWARAMLQLFVGVDTDPVASLTTWRVRPALQRSPPGRALSHLLLVVTHYCGPGGCRTRPPADRDRPDVDYHGDIEGYFVNGLKLVPTMISLHRSATRVIVHVGRQQLPPTETAMLQATNVIA